ncbi:hypothetical protein CIB48_g6078 [Xylaria polymorpha]|nr:hypothetical protein CIB48_g6078 [Xylaria polymorpha]
MGRDPSSLRRNALRTILSRVYSWPLGMVRTWSLTIRSLPSCSGQGESSDLKLTVGNVDIAVRRVVAELGALAVTLNAEIALDKDSISRISRETWGRRQ